MHRGSRRSSFLPELRGYNNRVLWEVHCGVSRRAWWSSGASYLTSRRSRRRPANPSRRRGRRCRMFSNPDVAFRGPCRSGSCVLQRWQGTRRSRTPLDKVPVCALRRSEGCVVVPDPSRGRSGTPVACAERPSWRGTWRRRTPFPCRRRVRCHTCDEVESGSSAERVSSRVAGLIVLPQHPGWRSSDWSWRTGLRSQPLWGMAASRRLSWALWRSGWLLVPPYGGRVSGKAVCPLHRGVASSEAEMICPARR